MVARGHRRILGKPLASTDQDHQKPLSWLQACSLIERVLSQRQKRIVSLLEEVGITAICAYGHRLETGWKCHEPLERAPPQNEPF